MQPLPRAEEGTGQWTARPGARDLGAQQWPLFPFDVLMVLAVPSHPRVLKTGLGGLGANWAWLLGPEAWVRRVGSPTGCHPAGGIRPLSHHTKLVPQSSDWAQVPSRDLLPIPALPKTRLCKIAKSSVAGGTWLRASPLPINQKVSSPCPGPSSSPPRPLLQRNPVLVCLIGESW